jgi:hypothetical protein
MTETEAQEALSKWATGELSLETLAELRAHALTCARCHEQYDRVSRLASALEGTAGLSRAQLELLERQVLERIRPKPAAPVQPAFARWRLALVPVALTLALIVWLVPRQLQKPGDEFAPRSAGGSLYGVRAFCVRAEPVPTVLAEAAPGGVLKCPTGALLQLTYSAPRPARLEVITADGSTRLFPKDLQETTLPPGVDVPLGLSSRVDETWLPEGTVRLVARFRSPDGRELLGESHVELDARGGP